MFLFVFKKIFSQKKYLILFFLFFSLFFLLFLFLPVFLNKNNFFLQLLLYQDIDYFIFFLFSSLLSFLLILQIYLFFHRKKKKIRHFIQETTLGTLSIYSGTLGGFLATASCSLCLISFLGFLGAGGILFFFQNRIWISLLAGAVILTSIFLALKSIKKDCDCLSKYERKRN